MSNVIVYVNSKGLKMALTVTTLSAFPNTSGSSVVDAAGAGLPAGNSSLGVATYAGLALATPNYFPNTTQYIAGYVDGTEHARLFEPSNAAGNVYNLPTLLSITQIFIVDSAGTTKGGGFRVALTPGSGSPDQSSPETVFLDQDAALILASTVAG